MSSKTKGAKSAAGAKLVGPFVPDPLPPVTPVPVGTDPKRLPFLEWSDQELNSEKWDIPKAKDKAKQKAPPTMKKTPSSTPAQFPLVNNPDEPLQFVDPHLVHLPHSLAVHEWKRPSEVYPDANFIMCKESSEYPDLISGSKHLLHSDFMRSFISAIGILEYLGNTRPSPIEFASPTFFPNTSDNPWRPWHHIYSMCKAGKGQKHNPQVNSLGKYAVRLFWMGCWRKIIIDDLLPIDLTNHVLLPTLDVPKPVESTASPPLIETIGKSNATVKSKNGKPSKPSSSKAEKNTPQKKEIELWPFLLCKALLKIASLTWTQCNEILDFDIVHCLTGWFVQKIDVTGLDVSDIWDMCTGYSDHYTWPASTQKEIGAKGSNGKSNKGSKSTSKESKATKSSKSGKKVSNFLDGEDSGVIPYHLIATCRDMRTVSEAEVPDIAPCWSHHFLIDQTRNIPLVKPDPLPELERWKRFRWLAWAISKELWPAPELIPIKCFKMVSVFKKCAEHVVYKPPSKEAIDIKKSVAVIEELALEMVDGKKKGGKDNSKKSGKDISQKSEKPSKSSKSDKSGKKGHTVVALPPDPSLWEDFNKLGPYISCLYIFFKSSLFSTNIKITDISQNISDKDGGKGKADKGKKSSKTESAAPKLLMWNNELLLSRNEPAYLFLDSIDYKLVVINFAQEGNTNILEKASNLAIACASELREKDSIQVPKSSSASCKLSQEITEDTDDPHYLKHYKSSMPFAYVVMENYNWQSSKVGDMTTFLNTYGTKTLLVDVKPGRFIMRLWIKSDTSYNINLMSDTPLVAGTLEVVLQNMSHEPERLLKMCHDISSNYGQLVQKFGTPQFTEELKSFYRFYLPDCKLSKLQYSQVHSAFLKEFLITVKENCVSQELGQRIFALKVLFMNPSLKLEQLKQISKETIDDNLSAQLNSEAVSQNSEEVDLVKITEKAAVTLQAFFKKLYIRKLKALHSQSHKDYMKIFDVLKKTYSDTFSIYKRMTTCPALIRNFLLSNSDMDSLRDCYLLLNDLNLSIHLQHFTGNVIAPKNTWLPITRHVFYCNSPEAVIVKVCLFSGFRKYMVRVFDNDTNKEIKRFTNNATVHAYNNNALGYTVLCYGWSDNESDLQWKLNFITLKQKAASLIIVPQVTIHNYILKQNYRPNVNNIICRCIVNINRDTLVTFRLSVSYGDVKLYFRCVNEVGQVFGEIHGTQSVILPAIMLKYVAGIKEGLESTVTSTTQSSTTQSISLKDRIVSKRNLRNGSLVRSSTNTSFRKRSKHFERISLDTFSIASDKKTRLSRVSEDIVKFANTTYIIEGFVVDDSWLLNKEEWNVVEELKCKSLLGPPTRNAIGSLSSITNKQGSSKQIVNVFRKSIDKKRQSFEIRPLVNPIWRLETISNMEDGLVARVDTRREEEIKNLKKQWYEDDPDRYEKSKQLRDAYLESQYIQWDTIPFTSFSKTASVASENCGESKNQIATLIQGSVSSKVFSQVLDVDKSIDGSRGQSHTIFTVDDKYKSSSSVDENLRTLKAPVSKTKMMPPLNLEKYFRDTVETQHKFELLIENEKEENEIEKHVKTLEDEEDLKIMRAQAIDEFELDQISYIEDMNKYLANQLATHKILDIFYKECRNESKEMMQEAYDLREKVIDLIIEAEKAKQPSPAQNEEKKDKKKKKK